MRAVIASLKQFDTHGVYLLASMTTRAMENARASLSESRSGVQGAVPAWLPRPGARKRNGMKRMHRRQMPRSIHVGKNHALSKYGWRLKLCVLRASFESMGSERRRAQGAGCEILLGRHGVWPRSRFFERGSSQETAVELIWAEGAGYNRAS